MLSFKTSRVIFPIRRVRLPFDVFGAENKNQKRNFTRIPAGTIGDVRGLVEDVAVAPFFVVLFRVNGRKLWAKVNPDSVEYVVE